MPFSDDGRLIPACSQMLGNIGQTVVNRRLECGYAIDVAIQDRSTTWRAYGIRDVTMIETHPLMRQTIHLGRFVKTRAVTVDNLRRMIIGHDENDIGLLAHTAYLFCSLSAISIISEDGLVREQDIIL